MNSQCGIEERRFVDRGTMAKQFATEIGHWLSKAVEQRGRACIVVSGGNTPKVLFDALSYEELPWEHVSVTLADERWVDPCSDQSNECLVRGHLLRNNAVRARFVPLKTGAETPETGERECNSRLEALPRPFDLVLLGIGGDGHTASLVSDAPELSELLVPSGRRLCGPSRPPSKSTPRITMTLPCLLDTRMIVYHLFGPEKWSVYRRALEGKDIKQMPVRAILQQAAKIPQVVFWAP